MDILGNNSVYVLKFCVFGHDMPYALEKIVMAEVSGDVESFSSATKIFISPLLQSLWPPNLIGW